MTFLTREIIAFDHLISNTGGGYIDNSTNANYGKFIASRNGTYKMNARVYNQGDEIGADMLRNGEFIFTTSKGGSGTGSLAAILDLTEGDEVYFVRPTWVEDDTVYHYNVCSFSGFLILADT